MSISKSRESCRVVSMLLNLILLGLMLDIRTWLVLFGKMDPPTGAVSGKDKRLGCVPNIEWTGVTPVI